MCNGELLGRGRINIPKGVYTHVIYTHGRYESANVIAIKQLEHPIVHETSGCADIDPIRNTDLLPRR